MTMEPENRCVCGHTIQNHRGPLPTMTLGKCNHHGYNPSTHEDSPCGCRAFLAKVEPVAPETLPIMVETEERHRTWTGDSGFTRVGEQPMKLDPVSTELPPGVDRYTYRDRPIGLRCVDCKWTKKVPPEMVAKLECCPECRGALEGVPATRASVDQSKVKQAFAHHSVFGLIDNDPKSPTYRQELPQPTSIEHVPVRFTGDREDQLEAAFWRFDANKAANQGAISERDIFKMVVRELLAPTPSDQSLELVTKLEARLAEQLTRIGSLESAVRHNQASVQEWRDKHNVACDTVERQKIEKADLAEQMRDHTRVVQEREELKHMLDNAKADHTRAESILKEHLADVQKKYAAECNRSVAAAEAHRVALNAATRDIDLDLRARFKVVEEQFKTSNVDGLAARNILGEMLIRHTGSHSTSLVQCAHDAVRLVDANSKELAERKERIGQYELDQQQTAEAHGWQDLIARVEKLELAAAAKVRP